MRRWPQAGICCGKRWGERGTSQVKRTVYYNGNVYTGKLPLAEAFVVEGERFVFAGSSEAALKWGRQADELVDLCGRFVCSGFIDSHMHLLSFGDQLRAAQLAARTESLGDMLDCLREFETEHPHTDGGWLIGRGWNQDYFTDVSRMPNRYDLDQVSTEVPVCAIRACGHCLVVNSLVLELLGVSADSSQPEGGQIGMEDGVPDGRFFDKAMDLVYDAIPVPDKEAVKEMLRTACRALNRYGVTSCHTDDYLVFRRLPWQVIHRSLPGASGSRGADRACL